MLRPRTLCSSNNHQVRGQWDRCQLYPQQRKLCSDGVVGLSSSPVSETGRRLLPSPSHSQWQQCSAPLTVGTRWQVPSVSLPCRLWQPWSHWETRHQATLLQLPIFISRGFQLPGPARRDRFAKLQQKVHGVLKSSQQVSGQQEVREELLDILGGSRQHGPPTRNELLQQVEDVDVPLLPYFKGQTFESSVEPYDPSWPHIDQ